MTKRPNRAVSKTASLFRIAIPSQWYVWDCTYEIVGIDGGDGHVKGMSKLTFAGLTTSGQGGTGGFWTWHETADLLSQHHHHLDL